MRSILLFSAFVAGSVAVGAQAADAALVHDLVTFTASGFTSAFGEPVPTDPVTGSFTITFDPTQTYVDQTVGITLNSLNISLGSTLAFDYSPTANSHGDADELVPTVRLRRSNSSATRRAARRRIQTISSQISPTAARAPSRLPRSPARLPSPPPGR